MRHILFVDDELNILEGLQRMLSPFRAEWQMTFASSAREALDIIGKQPCDVIVTDMRMPVMDGAQLLAEVRKHSPNTIRIILTGQSDNQTVYRSIEEAHQFLVKPCKPRELRECIDRALKIEALLNNENLKALVSQLGSLPSMPQVYVELRQYLASSESSAKDIAHIIEKDLAMTAKVLQLVNSAFFGLRKQVSSASQAVALLGFDTIKSLTLYTGLISSFRSGSTPSCFSFDNLWQHSITVALNAQAIACHESAPADISNDAFTAGILHDSGILILAVTCKEEFIRAYNHAVANGVSLATAEQARYGCTHAQVGAYLLGIWGLPHSIIEAVAFHHEPGASAGSAFSALTAVHAANAFSQSQDISFTDTLSGVDTKYVTGLGLGDRLDAWKSLCARKPVQGDAPHG